MDWRGDARPLLAVGGSASDLRHAVRWRGRGDDTEAIQHRADLGCAARGAWRTPSVVTSRAAEDAAVGIVREVAPPRGMRTALLDRLGCLRPLVRSPGAGRADEHAERHGSNNQRLRYLAHLLRAGLF